MNPSFLMLFVAACIFRLLASDAKRAFSRRLTALLPRNVERDHLAVLIREFPQRFAEFRARALPFFALDIFLNATACATFLAALWLCPPSGLSSSALSFLRWSGTIIVPLAFAADFASFFRLSARTFARRPRGEPPL